MGNTNKKGEIVDSNEDKYIEEIKKLSKEYKVLILSKTYCPYCIRAKDILNSNIEDKSNIFILELDKDPNGAFKQKALLKLHGQRTVPQIWINNKFIGGCSDIQTLLANGSLKLLLNLKQ